EPRAVLFDRTPLDGLQDGVERHAHERKLSARLDAAASSDRVKAERCSLAVLADIRRAGPSFETELETSHLGIPDRHAADAGDMNSAVGASAYLHRKLDRPRRPPRRRGQAGLVPEVKTRRGTGQHKIGAVRTDAGGELSDGPVDLGIDILRP